MPYRFPIRTGDRVALAPHTDLWMRGVRFGTADAVSRGFVRLTLDTGRKVVLANDDLLGVVV